MKRVISIAIFTFIVVNVVGFIVFLTGNQPNMNQNNTNTNSILNGNNFTLERIFRAVLAEHNTKEDCWIAYQGKVYDLTSWLPEHPGSSDAIAPFCGTAEEFENAFSGQHGTSQAERLIVEGIYKGDLQ